MPEHLWGMTTIPTRLDESLAGAVAQATAGDQAAFARIVRAHHDDMTRVCFVICGDLDLADEAGRRGLADRLAEALDPEGPRAAAALARSWPPTRPPVCAQRATVETVVARPTADPRRTET